MKFFFAICSLLTVAVAQEPSLSCTYFVSSQTYGCDLTINNPNGFDDFTGIGGTHLEGFGNADVGLIYRDTGVSTIVPRIICDTFPNLHRVEFYNTGVTAITETSFSGCSSITDLILSSNSISSIAATAFVNLPDIAYLDLERNQLSTLPENVFASQRNLTTLDLNFNLFQDIPDGLFQPLENIQYLYLGYCNIETINNQWFENNAHLTYLYLGSNRISELHENFVGLEGLTSLYLAYNLLSEIPDGAFAQLPNLRNLYLYGNLFTELRADAFIDLGNVQNLELSQNPIEVIHDGAFRGLTNLHTLYMANCGLRQLEPHSFEGLGNLDFLYLNFNEIEDLPMDLFAPLTNINYIGLWNNRLKTLHRNSFGTLTNLQILDLDGNIVNALDRAIIEDAVNLSTLFFSGNLCANSYFGNFQLSRDTYLPMLERCFANMRYIVDTTTEADTDFTFFEGPQPGIVFRVNSDSEAHIALTPFSFVWNPIVEVLIGTSNNTRSVIRINQETNVVTVPTPNIITRGQWNDFRITYANQVVLVFSGNSSFPFMGYTMEQFFPVNFYGLRAPDTRAVWTVQPFE